MTEQTEQRQLGTRRFDAQKERVETGPIQFGDDWPGVFIRGDNALGYAMHLDAQLQEQDDAIGRLGLKSLLKVLQSCDVGRPVPAPAPSPTEVICDISAKPHAENDSNEKCINPRPAPATAPPHPWRVGHKVPTNVYEGDRPVCQTHNPEDALRIVNAVNTPSAPAPATVGGLRSLPEAIEGHIRSVLKPEEAKRAIFAVRAAMQNWNELAGAAPAGEAEEKK